MSTLGRHQGDALPRMGIGGQSPLHPPAGVQHSVSLGAAAVGQAFCLPASVPNLSVPPDSTRSPVTLDE